MGSSISGATSAVRQSASKATTDMWEQLYESQAPSRGLRRELLIPFLAYRIQENALGGLKPRLRAELSRVRTYRPQTIGRKRLGQNHLTVGTRIIRKWRNNIYEVLATEAGYECGGERYRSLSEIARKITGTRWSGSSFLWS